MPISEEMVEVRSAINDDTNQPVYGNCRLSIGDGSVIVVFENGRSMVPRSVVERHLVNNGGIEVPSMGIWRQRGGGPAEVKTQAATDDLQGTPPAAEDLDLDSLPVEEKAELIGKLLGSLGVPPDKAAAVKDALSSAAASIPEAESEQGEPGAETEEQRRLRESAEELERLKAAGELDDDDEEEPTGDGNTAVARVVPAGFEDKTQEGEPRCLAHKSDKTQCKNAAVDGGPSCGLTPHQSQFAQ